MPFYSGMVKNVTGRSSSVRDQKSCGQRSGRLGFTLIEALVALTITTLACSALLLGMESSIRITDHSLQETQAVGIAEQMVDEVLGKRYAAAGAGPHQTWLNPSTWESKGAGRERFDDTDDYNGFVATPPEDVWGVELGRGGIDGGGRHPNFQVAADRFAKWQETVDVNYVDESDPSQNLRPGNPSGLRAVEVKILRMDVDGTETEIHRLRRVYVYIPEP